jgi:exodeoxyribonuclease V alpha subunit
MPEKVHRLHQSPYAETMKTEHIHRLRENGVLAPLDIHFADFVERLEGRQAPELWLAAALVSSHCRQGHICLDLFSVEAKPLPEPAADTGKDHPLICPGLNEWREKLMKFSVVGQPFEYKPLILDGRSRLYLHRYWQYQEKLASLVRMWVQEDEKNVDRVWLQNALARFFPGKERRERVNWQKVAGFAAVMKKFCIISGGPGTGKTTTVAKILALLIELSGSKELCIALAAPTGKAAARLKEVIKFAKSGLNCADNIKARIPEETSTIHRMLGSIPDSPYFRHHSKNELRADVVVVDEASMVDLALMSKLIQALPQEARLILLGDKDQLASVEAGAVLGDLCDAGDALRFSKRFCREFENVTGSKIDIASNGMEESFLSDSIVQLRDSFRFGREGGISALSRAVNRGRADLSVELLQNDGCKNVRWKTLPRPHAFFHAIREAILRGFGDYLRAIGSPEEIFNRFARFRVLCALRQGPYGVIAINTLIEQILTEEKLIEPGKKWYPGRPVLIARNDYHLHLFNGDVGIALPDSESNRELRVFFPADDGTLRKVHPLRLPEHETVYAMTVHKSQGSEFAELLLILPDRASAVLTRELIYTGITRAREYVEIWGTEDVFRVAVSRRINRASGLQDALWRRY